MASRGPRGTLAQTELDRTAATVEEDLRGRAMARADRNMVAGVMGGKGNVAGESRATAYKYRRVVARFKQVRPLSRCRVYGNKSPDSTPVRYFSPTERHGHGERVAVFSLRLTASPSTWTPGANDGIDVLLYRLMSLY